MINDLSPVAKITSEVLRTVAAAIKPGVTPKQLDSLAELTIKKLGAEPYNKGYHPSWAKTPYPATLCVNINDGVSHGIPGEGPLKDGDIVSIDVGVKKAGLAGDGAMTVHVGKRWPHDEKLLYHAKKALYEGIKVIKPGTKVWEMGKAIEMYANYHGYTVNAMCSGHFIGEKMHERPLIPHFNSDGLHIPETEVELKVGDTLCLEPMLTYEDNKGKLFMDGWTIKTRDGKKSAFFEAMIEVVPDGFKILTDHIDFKDCDG